MYNFGARKPERMYNIGAQTHTAHVTDRTTRPAKAHERGQPCNRGFWVRHRVDGTHRCGCITCITYVFLVKLMN